MRNEPDDAYDLDEGRDFYGYDFGDYRDYEGSEPDANDYGGRGPEHARRDYEGSDIRGYEGRDVHNYAGGYEGYYVEDEGRDPFDVDSWRWEAREDWGPVGEWSSRHSHDFERTGLVRRRVVAQRGKPARVRGRRRRVEIVGEQHSPLDAGFRGVAPKGYARPDSSIYEDICELLADADVDPSDVTVSVEDREVQLSGTVDDRWAKRYIEDLAYSVRGVTDVINTLRVSPQALRARERVA